MQQFVHLHVHSEYSLLDGAARINELVQRAAEQGMKALALTDHGVMYGAVPFYRACLQHGIKPIIGCEMYFTANSLRERGSRKDQPIYHLILLAKNLQGYRNLMKLCSIAQLEGFHYRPRIDMKHLEAYAEGLIVLSSCLAGEVSQHLLHDQYDLAKAAAERYRAVFGDDFYLELQDHGIFEQKKVNQRMVQLSEETGIPLVATNDVHYVHPDDHGVQDVLICIGTGKTLDDQERLRFQTDQLYLKSGAEMAELFPHLLHALERTAFIAEQCELKLELGGAILPQFEPIPAEQTAQQYLMELCREGIAARYAELPEWQDSAFQKLVEQRLTYEWSVITTMGFTDYFLIVWDFIRYAREQGIPIGPGRGSSAGSLIAYVLMITDVDPIKYGLLFERFLNPERISMPDIDIDFSDERRDEVIDYVAQKYGKDRVAQIITFGTMAARAAVRDVGRVLNLPYHEVDRAAKLIPNQVGVTLDQAMQSSAELRELYTSKEQLTQLLDYARRVEGFPRHASTHAAGVVISREPLTHYTPLQAGTEEVALTQYSMENLEAIGLLKMDFLGLRTLSIIERTIHWIAELSAERIDFRWIADDDPVTYAMLGKGETTGVFQLESPGMRRVLKEMKPSHFEDIISVLALYRPGPMEFIPKFIQAKHGQISVEYPHASLEPILADTYGIIVYQEQIMQIASQMAGFSLGEADLLRRAVSKKNRDVLDQERAHFVRGCKEQGFDEATAHSVYDMIVRFADYGFPRAHAAAYAVLAFQTAYLKAHYPAQFMAAMLTSVMGSHKKIAEYADECRRMSIPVMSPDVNESGVTFTPVFTEGSWAIRFGLGAIRNVGVAAIEAIQRERKEAHFTDLTDFCQRIDLRLCNKRVIESLILSGAFDSLPGHRAQKLAVLEDCLDLALKWKKERDDLQLHLFGFTEQANWTVELPEMPPYTSTAKLEFERDMLGMYLSGHPLDAYETVLEERGVTPLHHLPEQPDGSFVQVAGMVTSVKSIVNRRGKAMAFVELEDRIDKVEIVVFPERWQSDAKLIHKGALLLLQAKLQHNDEEVSLLAERIYALDELPSSLPPLPEHRQSGVAQPYPAKPNRRNPTKKDAPPHETRVPTSKPSQRIFVKITAAHEQPEKLQQLQALLQRAKGMLEVVLYYEREQKLIVLSDHYRVKPSPELFQQIEKLLGNDTVKVK